MNECGMRLFMGNRDCNLPEGHADTCGFVIGTMMVRMADGRVIEWAGFAVPDPRNRVMFREEMYGRTIN